MMTHEKKQSEPDDAPGAPEWMVTFSDCMTLLLTFFVLLLSFSSFDERIFKKLQVIYSEAFSSILLRRKATQDASIFIEPIAYQKELQKGSEKPTLEKAEEGILNEGEENFRKHKVFLMPSSNVFWGKGSTISYEGQRILTTMAEFLKQIPGRVVISENARISNNNSENFCLTRAWTVKTFLTEQQKLDKNRFSISAGSTIGKEGFEIISVDNANVQPDRILEIVLLERSVYN